MWWFQSGVITGALALGICCLAEGLDSSPPCEPQELTVVFVDDFAMDSRRQYRVEGDVAWREGQLTLEPDTSLARAINGGPETILELSLELVPPTETRQLSHAGLLLSFDGADDCLVMWSLRRDDDSLTGWLRIADTARSSNEPPRLVTVREWPLEPELIAGRWKVHYHRGLITAVPNPKSWGEDGEAAAHGELERFLGYVAKGSSDVQSVLLTAGQQPVTLRQLAASSLPPRRLEPADRQRLEEASRLHGQATELQQSGRPREALPLAGQAVDIHRDVQGEEDADFAGSLHALADVHRALGQFLDAERHYTQARDIRKKVLGEEHPLYAVTLNHLGALYWAMADYTRAESLYLEAGEIWKRVLGDNHPDYAANLSNLGALYWATGEYAKAEPFLHQACQIDRDVYGEEHPDFATSLNNLAGLYQEIGDYPKAESLLLQTRDIRWKTLGDEHPEYAISLNNLANLYRVMGEYAKAEPLLVTTADIWKNTLGDEHPFHATSLANLGGLYESVGDYARAEKLFLQARDIRRRIDDQHPSYALSLDNLSGVYWATGDFVRAEECLVQARVIWKRVLGEEHPNYARHLNNLAVLYQSMGKHPEAETLYLQARDIRRTTLGEQHPSYVNSLHNLARLYHVMGNHDQVEPLSRQALETNLRHLAMTLPWLSEAQAISLIRQQPGAGLWLSAAREMPEQVSPLDVWSAVWRTRGLVSAMLLEHRLPALTAPEGAPIVQRLRGVQRQLAQQTLAVPDGPEQYEARRQRLAQLNEEKESLERQLAATSAEFRAVREYRDVGPEDLITLLPAGTAAVDLAEVSVYRQSAEDHGAEETERHYEAFVVQAATSDMEEPSVSWVSLGPSEPIREALRQWRELLRERHADAVDERDRARRVRQLVWEPIEPYLGGSDSVILIPDGELTALPWAALPGKRPQSYLLEDFALGMASHGRQLHRLLTETSEPKDGVLLVVGGVDYDMRHGSGDSAVGRADWNLAVNHFRGAAIQERTPWNHLPGTVEEVAELVKHWPHALDPVRITGSAATEEALRAALPAARYVHLATHGFFADPKFRSMFGHDVASERIFGSHQEGFAPVIGRGDVTARNPLLLSGVVLAGANLPPEVNDLGLPTSDDGILTAEEVVHLDLRGTELVVLSACETGLGELAGGGEGVFGLQRAFHLAGARCVVASLWNVHDRATQAMMVEFYRNMWEEQLPKREALRQAQLAMLNGYDLETGEVRGVVRPLQPLAPQPPRTESGNRLPPYYWAAFVLSGDWR